MYRQNAVIFSVPLWTAMYSKINKSRVFIGDSGRIWTVLDVTYKKSELGIPGDGKENTVYPSVGGEL